MNGFKIIILRLFHGLVSFMVLFLLVGLSATSTMVWTLDNHVVGDRQCVKYFPNQLSGLLTGNKTCTTRTVNNPSCAVREAIITLYFERNVAHLEVFHVAHIVVISVRGEQDGGRSVCKCVRK